MKILKQTIFVMVFVIGISISALAQNHDQKKPPPKEEPPKIVIPEKKDPPREKPRDDNKNNDNRGKKPEMAVLKISNEAEII